MGRNATSCLSEPSHVFDTSRLVRTIEDSARWRASSSSLYRRAEALTDRLADAAEQGRTRLEEQMRWKAMSKNLLGGLDSASALTASAALRRNGPGYRQSEVS